MDCMRRGSHPPYPTPLRKGGKVGGIWAFFPPCERGTQGRGFECLCVTPGSASRRLKTALVNLVTSESPAAWLGDVRFTVHASIEMIAGKCNLIRHPSSILATRTSVARQEWRG